MKLLVIKSSSMGDVVHALPVAVDIKEHFPDAALDWVVEESFRDIPDLSKDIDCTHITAFRRWQKAVFSRSTWAEIEKVRHEIANGGYDLVIDLQGLARTGLVAHWAKAPVAGFSFNTVREKPAALAYASGLRFALPETMGAVHRYRALAGRALGYEPEGRPRFNLRSQVNSPVKVDGPYAAMAVNTSQDRKLWPEKNWIEVGKALAGAGLKTVFFWGSKVEHERVERLAASIPMAVVAPRLPLSAIAAVLEKASLVVGVDTGISHLGAAMGRPTAGIFVQTSLEKVPIVGDGRYVNIGGPGMMPTSAEVIQHCEALLK